MGAGVPYHRRNSWLPEESAVVDEDYESEGSQGTERPVQKEPQDTRTRGVLAGFDRCFLSLSLGKV